MAYDCDDMATKLNISLFSILLVAEAVLSSVFFEPRSRPNGCSDCFWFISGLFVRAIGALKISALKQGGDRIMANLLAILIASNLEFELVFDAGHNLSARAYNVDKLIRRCIVSTLIVNSERILCNFLQLKRAAKCC